MIRFFIFFHTSETICPKPCALAHLKSNFLALEGLCHIHHKTFLVPEQNFETPWMWIINVFYLYRKSLILWCSLLTFRSSIASSIKLLPTLMFKSKTHRKLIISKILCEKQNGMSLMEPLGNKPIALAEFHLYLEFLPWLIHSFTLNLPWQNDTPGSLYWTPNTAKLFTCAIRELLAFTTRKVMTEWSEYRTAWDRRKWHIVMQKSPFSLVYEITMSICITL